jgi:hypothetical protein
MPDREQDRTHAPFQTRYPMHDAKKAQKPDRRLVYGTHRRLSDWLVCFGSFTTGSNSCLGNCWLFRHQFVGETQQQQQHTQYTEYRVLDISYPAPSCTAELGCCFEPTSLNDQLLTSLAIFIHSLV